MLNNNTSIRFNRHIYKVNKIYNYINMDLTKIFAVNFIYGGIILGIILTLMDVIKSSKSLIGLYAFLAGSFFIINLIQYKYVRNLNESLTNHFLVHSIIGGIVWVGLASLLYYLHKSKLDEMTIIISMLSVVIFITIVYYNLFKN